MATLGSAGPGPIRLKKPGQVAEEGRGKQPSS